MKNQTVILPNPSTWGLSPQAIALLSREPDILTGLAEDRLLPPLPPGYVPRLIEVLFDDVPYIRSESGAVTYLRECWIDYQPAFVEYRFDGEIALFQVGDELVINRIEGMAYVTASQRNLP